MIPRGIRNNNPGNIVKTNIPWLGKVKSTDSRFEKFDTMENGIRAMLMDIRSDIKKKKMDTIRKLISSYAPPNENNTEAYINAVAHRTGIGADDRIIPDESTLCRLAEAISFHENGGCYITMGQITLAWGMM